MMATTMRRLGRLGPRSEEWRLHWCFRTCVSIAVCCFLYFFVPTRTVLMRYTDPPFTVFVAAMVKDATLGSTIMNIWACILGSLIATVLVQIIYSCLAASVESPDQYPISMLLVVLFVTVFGMQYLELPLMGKRLGVSLLALNIVSWPEFPDIPINVWRLYLSVVVGCACGIVGAVLPLPMRLAGVEVNKRLHYCCNTICDLLREEISAWIHEPSKAETLQSVWKAQHLPESPHSVLPPWRLRFGWPSPPPTASRVQARWRKVRRFFQSLHAFRHAHRYGTSWIVGRSIFKLNDRPVRAEMLLFLQSQLDLLVQRIQEARFEQPSRSKALQVFHRYIGLLRLVVQVQRQLEVQVHAVDKAPQAFQLYFADPDFRRAVYRLVEAIAQTLQALFDLMCQRCAELQHVAQEMVALRQAQSEVDRVYEQVTLRLHASRTKTDKEGVGGAEGGERGPGVASSPLDASNGMHTVLFLLDHLADSLFHFHSPDELSWMQLNSCCQFRGQRNVYQNSWRQTLQAWRGLLSDLLPSQAPAAFCRVHSLVPPRIEWIWTPAVRFRCLHAGMVATAMVLAAIYGILNERKQPALASFTVAYLAGFPASGMNLITAINRTAGTIVASIFVIFVVLLYGQLPEWAYAARSLLLATAAVGFQLPATYVRSFPIPSYSGTVASFTTALLLFAEDPTVEQSIRRVLDTCVGVAIFMVCQLVCFGQSSESILLQDARSVLLGVRKQFLEDVSVVKKLSSRQRLASSKDEDGGAAEKKKENEVEEEEEEEAGGLLARLAAGAQELDQLSALLAKQRALMPFYKLEPRLLTAPSLSERLWGDLCTAQQQAIAALSRVRWVVDKVRIQSCQLAAYHNASSLPRTTKGRLDSQTARREESVILPPPEALAGRLRSHDLLYYYRHLSTRPPPDNNTHSSVVSSPLTAAYHDDDDVEAARDGSSSPTPSERRRLGPSSTSSVELAAGPGSGSALLTGLLPPDLQDLAGLAEAVEGEGEEEGGLWSWVAGLVWGLQQLQDTGTGRVHSREEDYAPLLRHRPDEGLAAVSRLCGMRRARGPCPLAGELSLLLPGRERGGRGGGRLAGCLRQAREELAGSLQALAQAVGRLQAQRDLAVTQSGM